MSSIQLNGIFLEVQWKLQSCPDLQLGKLGTISRDSMWTCWPGFSLFEARTVLGWKKSITLEERQSDLNKSWVRLGKKDKELSDEPGGLFYPAVAVRWGSSRTRVQNRQGLFWSSTYSIPSGHSEACTWWRWKLFDWSVSEESSSFCIVFKEYCLRNFYSLLLPDERIVMFLDLMDLVINLEHTLSVADYPIRPIASPPRTVEACKYTS